MKAKDNVYLIFCLLWVTPLFSQQPELPTQSLRGQVVDGASGAPISSATITLMETNLMTRTDSNGYFQLETVPVGRYKMKITHEGYRSWIEREMLISSGKRAFKKIHLESAVVELQELHVQPRGNRNGTINEMAVLGGQRISVEEASRYAGSMDDPGRLVSSLAGVSHSSISSNGVSVRGNAPALLQWRLEGVEIPNPNHFADLEALGGGFLSALSPNVLGNSDFFQGAFPSEYNNAISGVFDMYLREGSTDAFQHTIQLGILGLDVASEGPISKKHGSSYLFNYRYSTTKLLENLRGKEKMGGTLGYQDLNIKLSFPTEKYGDFKLWGIGLIDEVDPIPEDPEDWLYIEEGFLAAAKQRSGAAGLSHAYRFANQRTSLHTSFAFTHLDNRVDERFQETAHASRPKTDLQSRTDTWVLTSQVKHKFSARHLHKSGLTITRYHHGLNLKLMPNLGEEMVPSADYRGHTELLSAFSNSRFDISPNLDVSLGLSLQYLTLGKEISVEPRLGMKWSPVEHTSFAIGYGLHSRMERPDTYFVRDENGHLPNIALGLTKGHHFLLTYQWHVTQDMRLQIEPYYQYLYQVPVAADGSSYSILNRDAYYFSQQLTDRGHARNYGVDISFSKYMTDGFYYRGTVSWFDSKFQDGQGRWFSSRYDRGFIVNGLIGKEWMLGRNRLGINLRVSLLGGKRYTPVDREATLSHPHKQVQYQEDQAYSRQFDPMLFGDFSITYRLNREKVGHEFALKSVNATGEKDYLEHRFNIQEEKIEPFSPVTSMYNLSYRFEF